MKIKILLALVMSLSLVSVFAQTEEPMAFTSQGLSFTYEAGFLSDVIMEEVAEVPYDENMPYWAANPAYTRYDLVDYGDDMESFHMPAIYVFPTENFAAFGTDNVYTFQGQFDALTALLAEGTLDLSVYSEMPTTSGETNLPFLPLFNAAQVFRAQPQLIDFQNGRGIRYLSYYSQAVNPITNAEIFYTFQGLTEDGAFYVAAILPVNTGLFGDDVTMDGAAYEEFANQYTTYLEESLTGLNELALDASTPTLTELDALIMSLMVGE